MPDDKTGTHDTTLGQSAYPRPCSDAVLHKSASGHTGRVSADPMSTFSLRPFEDMLPGVRLRDGILRLRPTWAVTSGVLYGGAFGLLAIAAGTAATIAAPDAFIAVVGIAFIVVGATQCFLSAQYLNCRVVTQGHGLLVVNRWWKRRLIEASDIKVVRVDKIKPTWFWPYRAPLTLWPRTLTAGVLITHDNERVQCDALVSGPRVWGEHEASPAETKTAVLQRWVEAATASSRG